MRLLKSFLLVPLMLLATQELQAQTSQEKATAKAREAIQLADDGKIDESMKLMEEAHQLDPENIVYPYELGYDWYAKKEYTKAIEVLTPLLKHKDVNGKIYQLLGNSYDNSGNGTKAVETYEKGLKKFPASGELYLELGNIYAVKKEYNKAMSYYETGIRVDPSFPSNYYHAAQLYCLSDEEVWGMIYGELFMNLERNTERTATISKLLYDTYKSEIKFESDTSMSVSFSKGVIDASTIKDPKKIRLPYGTGVYEPMLILSIIGSHSININSLDTIRRNFVNNYFQKNNAKEYPNVLFDYQKKVLNAGHMEAYNHWILMKGDEAAFQKWQVANYIKWESFAKWFAENGLSLDKDNKFYRTQYE